MLQPETIDPTGSSPDELARVLKRRWARRIHVLRAQMAADTALAAVMSPSVRVRMLNEMSKCAACLVLKSSPWKQGTQK